MSAAMPSLFERALEVLAREDPVEWATRIINRPENLRMFGLRAPIPLPDQQSKASLEEFDGRGLA